MPQLIMNWQNDGTAEKMPSMPKEARFVSFENHATALSDWLEIVRFLEEDGSFFPKEDYYDKTMLSYKNYTPDKCFFLLIDGKAAATITVICDYEQKRGYIHMVASKPEYRNKGYGKLLNDLALFILKKEQMQTAYLTTDDWRLAAISTYLNAGFKPDLSSQSDFKERWDKIFKALREYKAKR